VIQASGTSTSVPFFAVNVYVIVVLSLLRVP
jgi:hypothetical protein